MRNKKLCLHLPSSTWTCITWQENYGLVCWKLEHVILRITKRYLFALQGKIHILCLPQDVVKFVFIKVHGWHHIIWLLFTSLRILGDWVVQSDFVLCISTTKTSIQRDRPIDPRPRSEIQGKKTLWQCKMEDAKAEARTRTRAHRLQSGSEGLWLWWFWKF